MRDYKSLSKIYDTKFLNYIINRSKQLSYKWHMDYNDLVGDGLLKLVELYAKQAKRPDQSVMASLVHMYNDIWEKQKTTIHPMSINTMLEVLKVEEPEEEEDG